MSKERAVFSADLWCITGLSAVVHPFTVWSAGLKLNKFNNVTWELLDSTRETVALETKYQFLCLMTMMTHFGLSSSLCRTL